MVMVPKTVLDFTGFGEDKHTLPKGGVEHLTTSKTRVIDCDDKRLNFVAQEMSGCVEDTLLIQLQDEASSPCSSTDSGSESEDQMTAMLKQMESLKQAIEEVEEEELQSTYFFEEDLSQYYFSDEEEEESSDEMYTEWDAVEYKSEANLQKELSRGESESEEKEVVRMLAQRAQAERRMMMSMLEHNQFDLQSVKALWLEEVDTSAKLPGFTLVLTSNEDSMFFRKLCQA